MKVGDKLKINGNLGFLSNPEMVVVDLKPGMVKLRDTKAKEGGLLSHMNESWYGIDLINSRSTPKQNTFDRLQNNR